MNSRDQAGFVSTNIEHHSIVGQYVRAPEHLFEIGGLRPICSLDDARPRSQGLFSVGSSGPGQNSRNVLTA
jgi:hypothetical protein